MAKRAIKYLDGIKIEGMLYRLYYLVDSIESSVYRSVAQAYVFVLLSILDK